MSGRERGKGQGVRDRTGEKRSSGEKELPSQARRGKGVGGWETGRRVEGRGEKGVDGEARPGGQSWSSFLPAGPSQLLEHLHLGGGVSKWSCLFLDFLPHTLGPAPLGPSQRACGSSYSSASVQTAKSALKVCEQLGKDGVSRGKQCLLLDVTTPGAGGADWPHQCCPDLRLKEPGNRSQDLGAETLHGLSEL